MREWQREKVWVKAPKSTREKARDLMEIKGIYRARGPAES
jgi:hypothetical protein